MKKVYQGMTVNYLTVIDDNRFHKDGDYHKGYYLCKCKCGNEKYINDHSLVTGRIRDCGCGTFLKNKYIGKRSGMLQVLDAFRESHNGKVNIMLKCKCDCGKEKIYKASYFTSKQPTSCGCQRDKKKNCSARYSSKEIDKRIGEIWSHILMRCYNEKSASYKYYGGRGIKVCDEWRNSALAFYNWAIENGYKDDLTIDRINNDGNYEPSNCRWVDRQTQANNTSRNIYVEYNGERMTISQIAKIKNISPFTIYSRIRNGMSPENAINLSIIKRNKKYE